MEMRWYRLETWAQGLRARSAWLARRTMRRSGMPLLLVVLLVSGTFAQLAQAGFGAHLPVAQAAGMNHSDGGKPNLFDPHSNAKSVLRAGFGRGKTANAKAGPPQSLKRTGVISMLPGALLLVADHATTFTGNDGRLEVDVPVGAATSADLAAAGGRLSLEISQIAPAAGSNAGGSGLVSFGTYLVQLVDAHGVLVSHGLRKPVTIKLHYGTRESALPLQHAFVVFNGSLPDGTALAPLTAPAQPSGPGHTAGGGANPDSSGPTPTMATSHFGRFGYQNASLDPKGHTLSIQPLLSDPSSSMSWNTNAPIGTFGKPDPFNVDLSAGSLSASFPIDVPSGPGGLTPPVNLAYSSAGVSEQHSPQGATGWVGEGWSMGLGSISWSEHNVTSNCVSTCGNTWEDSWQLSDPFGTASELIPPDINTTTYYDDSTFPITGSPVQWHTAPETHAKVYSYVSSLTLPYPAGPTRANPPCFRVFLPNGIMEEFGCTADSIQYYPEPSGSNYGLYYISSWNLDLITDPQGNQIHITYTDDRLNGADNLRYSRDVVLNTIEWDSPTCQNAQTACSTTGTAPNLWQPLMRVSFSASHTPTRWNNPTGCNTGSNLRCDDPLDLSGSSGLAAPDVQSTYVLNDILAQVNNSTNGGGTYSATSWNTLKDYQLTYQASGPTTVTDPSTGKQDSTAGKLLLTQLVTVGDDGTTALPTRTFGYSKIPEYYEDDIYHPNPNNGTNCGPSWNTGNAGSGCLLWSQSYEGNGYYISTADNGLGLHQIFTWDNGRNNTHGVNGGGTNTADPTYCNTHQTGYPCNEADDQNWSHTILTKQEGDVLRSASTNPPPGYGYLIQSITQYAYKLTYPLAAQECTDCVAGMYWGNQNDGDYLDYYNAKFMGFAEADVNNPDSSLDVHKYYATEGYGVYDTTQVPCYAYHNATCHNAPWWDLGNVAHGHEYEADSYDTNGTTLLKKTTTQYQAICPPSGVTPTPPWTGTPNYGNWKSNLVSELDHNNPVAACDVQTTRTDEYTFNGASGTVPQKTTTYSYDSYGRTTKTTVNSNGGGSQNGSPTVIVTQSDYVWRDAVTATSTGATGTYLIDLPADTIIEDSGNTTHYSCSFTSYDGHAFATNSQSWLALGEVTTKDQYTGCGTSANSFATSGLIRSTHTYDSYGNQLTTNDPDANAGDTTHLGCTVGSTTYSTCAAFDTVFFTRSTSTTNAKNQSELTGYGTPAASNGFGLWPISTTDKNTQTTTYAYDALGRMTSRTLPGETNAPTTSWTYSDWCSATGAQTPCIEVDQTQRLTSSNTITSRAFYDGYGNLVETRDPGPNGNDVVRYREYDASERDVFDSISYLVTAYTGAPGSAAFSVPDKNQAGTSTVYDGLDRTTKVTDALSHATTTTYTSNNWEGASVGDLDTNTYDPLGHRQYTITDALGRVIEEARTSGNGTTGNPYAYYGGARYTYDSNGNLVSFTTRPVTSLTTTFTYDAAGRKTGMTDPDRGTETYTYDADGNRTKSVDARSSDNTVYAGYDPLDRELWRNTSNSPTGAYDTFAYDSIAGGNYGVGHLTSEAFTGGPNRTLSGSYTYVYNARGEQTSNTETVGSSNYTVLTTYDDSGNTLTQQYPDGETVTNGYTGQGWLAQVSTSQGSTTLLANVDYSGFGGAGHLMTGATLGNGAYRYSATYDQLLRLSDVQLTRLSDSAKLFEESRSFDNAGNLTTLATTLPEGTDSQAFCYDEQDRVTWAGSTGTAPCGVAFTPGSLTAANYTQSFAYDTVGRLTSGPLGSATYGGAHPHATTAIGSAYTAAYDAAGNMTCRAPTSATTCSGTQTGAQLSYDNEGQLSAWQDKPSSPSSTDAYLYDGEGNRVEQQVTTGLPASPTTTTTVYVGNLEEIATTGSTTTTTSYYYAGELRIALAVNGSLSYLATDALGSTTVAFNASGTATAATLYAPYGGARYSDGTMPTDYGFTGQHSDAATGLDYYNARYYDPLASQFTSADTTLPGNGYDIWGLSRYAYVEGNPLIRVDPTGHDGGWLGGLVSAVTSTVSTVVSTVAPVVQAVAPAAVAVLDATTGIPSMINDVKTIFSGNASTLDKIMAGADILINVAMDVSMVVGVGEGLRAAYVGAKVAEHVAVDAAEHGIEHAGESAIEHAAEHEAEDEAAHAGEKAAESSGDCLSFSADTLVATPVGEQAIASLKVGDHVVAYDPQTGTASAQTVQATSIHHDTNLVDVTLRVTTPATTASAPTQQAWKIQPAAPPTAATGHTQHAATSGAVAMLATHDEVVQTTANHPWLTADHGWLIASFLHIGEPVQRVDGSTATVVAVRSVPGAASMWDLTVSNVHTFAVGTGQFVVHNCPELDNWRSHTPHFAEQWVKRGKPSTTEMDNVLKNGTSLFDTTTGNFGQAGKIGKRWYSIWYDATDGNKLVSITDEASGGYKPYSAKLGSRWLSPSSVSPGWINPFDF